MVLVVEKQLSWNKLETGRCIPLNVRRFSCSCQNRVNAGYNFIGIINRLETKEDKKYEQSIRYCSYSTYNNFDSFKINPSTNIVGSPKALSAFVLSSSPPSNSHFFSVTVHVIASPKTGTNLK